MYGSSQVVELELEKLDDKLKLHALQIPVPHPTHWTTARSHPRARYVLALKPLQNPTTNGLKQRHAVTSRLDPQRNICCVLVPAVAHVH